MNLGSTLALSARLTPSTAQSALTWRSSSTNIASVDGNGVVTAHSAGTTTITVTTAQGNMSASISITVVDPSKPTQVSLSQTGTISLGLNSQLQLNAIVTPSTSTAGLTWRSSSPSVASVDENGVITPHKEGVTTISVSAGDLRQVASVRIEVTDPLKPTAITLNETTGTIDLALDKTLTLKATLAPATAKATLTWRSSSTAIATVDEQGVVTPHREGITAITVTADNSRLSATVNVRIVDPKKPTEISLSPSDAAEMNLSETLSLKATVQPETAEANLRWRSSSTSVATVDGDGLVTSGKEGTTTITVTAEGTKLSASIRITVVDPGKPSGVTLNRPEEFDMTIHDIVALKATVEPETSSATVTWESSKPSIVAVDENGLVTPQRQGTARVVATIEGTRLRASTNAVNDEC